MSKDRAPVYRRVIPDTKFGCLEQQCSRSDRKAETEGAGPPYLQLGKLPDTHGDGHSDAQ